MTPTRREFPAVGAALALPPPAFVDVDKLGPVRIIRAGILTAENRVEPIEGRSSN